MVRAFFVVASLAVVGARRGASPPGEAGEEGRPRRLQGLATCRDNLVWSTDANANGDFHTCASIADLKAQGKADAHARACENWQGTFGGVIDYKAAKEACAETCGQCAEGGAFGAFDPGKFRKESTASEEFPW